MNDGVDSLRRRTVRMLDEGLEVSYRTAWCLVFVHKWLVFICITGTMLEVTWTVNDIRSPQSNCLIGATMMSSNIALY